MSELAWIPRGLIRVAVVVPDEPPPVVEPEPVPEPRRIHDLIACPTCHARIDELCRTTTGRHREAHASRLVPKRCGCGATLLPNKKLCDDCRAAARRENGRIGMRNTRARRRMREGVVMCANSPQVRGSEGPARYDWGTNTDGLLHSRQGPGRLMPSIVPSERSPQLADVPDLFEVIYADPPWRYDNGTPGREIERHYPTMTHEEICDLAVPAARDAVLFLWGVAPKLPEALGVMTAWGFTYRTGAVWDKELVGMGYWFRGQHEHLLVGVKGNWSPPPQPLRVSSVYRQARGRHSKKPDVVRQQIATWWPDARRLEMFCRYPSPGWHVWGNQVDSSVADLPFERFDPHADPGQGDLFGGVA